MIVVAAMVAATLITGAFGSDDTPPPGVVVDWIRDGDQSTARAPAPTSEDNRTGTYSPTATPVPAGAAGFGYPIADACLPEHESLMPGAPREYRRGIHEGVDFYESDNCVFIGLDTEALAAKSGTVIRADWGYEDLTWETLAELEQRVERGDSDDPEVQDAFRGRQVWLDHGDGIVTRYAHLAGIADGIVVGAEVEQGAVIGYVGESGAPESVTAPGTQVHLHFEIRVGDTYLGQGLDPDDAYVLYQQAFSP